MSIASQLQAIKSLSKGKEDPIHRPLTRPSVLFGPKEAADIDLRSILPLAQYGLDALIEGDGRFLTYKTTLFSHATLDINREKMPPKEEEKLNKSISSYLQLLAGHLHLPAALRTLEYLIRRYQIHIFNVEELVLCALPYHDTHSFVRIVQLMDFGNKKWAFLEGVKTSGAPPPRKVIVNQCVRDKGVLESLCNYASPTKGFQHSRTVICFCTAVIVDVLGSVPKLDTDTLQRILTFVFNGINPTISGSPDHNAGALMIVGLVATRTTLASKLVQNLILFIARFARHEANKSSDLQSLHLAVVALVILMQSQSIPTIPKNAMMILKDIRDFVGILSGLSQEFNIRKFLQVYIESLIDYSSSDDSYYHLLVNVLKALPVGDIVEKIVDKILAQCMKFLNADNLRSHLAGSQVKQILAVIDEQYPSELQGAVHKFLRNSKMKLGEDESIFLVFCRMLDGSPDMPMEMSDSKIWFSLEHPKASVRRATLIEISSSDSLKSFSGHQQKLVNDSLLRRLQDDDLTVIQAVLSINGLSEVLSPPSLLKAFHDVFLRCIDMMRTSTKMVSQVVDVAALCLRRMVLDIPLHHNGLVKEVADIIFPALLVLPQTWRLNIKALELVRKLHWPSYSKSKICDPDFFDYQVKRLEHGQMTELNLRTIRALAETLVENPLDHMEWLVGCSKQNNLAKCLVFFIILQALVSCKDFAKLSGLFEACFSALKNEWFEMLFVDNGLLASKFLKEEWCEVESHCTVIIVGELNMKRFDKAYMRLANQLLHSDADMLSKKILISVNWCLLEKFTTVARANKLLKDQQLLLLDQLFLFFSASSSINIFKKQLPVVVMNCCEAPFNFLSKYFVEEGFSSEVQAESLFAFASLSSLHSSDRRSTNESTLLPLLMFPSLLVPLTSANKVIRTAAVNCVEGIYKLWLNCDVSRLNKGDDVIFLQCVSTPNFGNFLESILDQKRLILSDANFLPSFLTSMLSSASDSLLVPDSYHKRFSQSYKDAVLRFILTSALKFPSYGKQKVLSFLKAMGNALLQVEGCKELLLGLFKKRDEYYIESGKLGERLSETEIDTLCLLLELCTLQLTSSINDVCISCLLKVLKVDSLLLDQPSITKPCITVLKNLTSTFYIILDSNIQSDHHSQQVLENLISVLVPCWLAKTNSVGKLFQIFVEGLPGISEHRKMTIMLYLLRMFGEKDNLGILYYHLFRSLTLRLKESSFSESVFCELFSASSLVDKEWEYIFALQLCNQYSSKIWLPSLLTLLKEVEICSKGREYFLELFLALQFIFAKLRDAEFVFELESGRDASYGQATLGALMEQVVLHLQLIGVRCKQLGFSSNVVKEVRKDIHQILKTLTTWMRPDIFFRSIGHLLDSDDDNVIAKTLVLLCESVKDQASGQYNRKRAKRMNTTSVLLLKITDDVVPSFIELCSKINQLISSSSRHIRVKLAAVSAIETLAKELPCDGPVFASCLQYVVEESDSSDVTLSSACIRTMPALIRVLGPQALNQLPSIMTRISEKIHEVSTCPHRKSKKSAKEFEAFKVPLLQSTLSALETVITNLGGFLNPYLDNILDIVILHPEYVSDLEAKIKTRASAVRKLLTQKVSVRLMLPALLKLKETALECGESSFSVIFEMLQNLIGVMDKSSINSYHVNIYEYCLDSLDIRRQGTESVKDMNFVEKSILQAMVVLTMKLTETMFRPLFFQSLEWAESEIEGQSTKCICIDRYISFYGLVNKLIQQHRTLFVPYFKFFLESCTRYLTEDQLVDSSSLPQRRKKTKGKDSHSLENSTSILSIKLWHLRALILKALYHGFLYDTAETKFLDASNFQVLLKPIISQLIVEPPVTLNDFLDSPTVEEVDQYLVLCLGQMAVTIKSDVLWKPLNHEVLMQTRSEQVRPKIVGLKVIQYLVEHLREEYLVFMPETIPFLGELLEDIELPVKTLAQEILRMMEALSGESLKEYL